MDKEGYEELDRTLREVWGKNVLFAGIPVLLADDFRQTFPAIKKGTPADLESSHLFATLEPYWTASSSYPMTRFEDDPCKLFAQTEDENSPSIDHKQVMLCIVNLLYR